MRLVKILGGLNMPDANRKETAVAYIVMILWGVFYWASMVTLALGMLKASLIASIGYAVCNVVFEEILLGKYLQRKNRILLILCAEAMQIVPYVLIFVIRELS